MAVAGKSITDVSEWRLAGVEPTGLDPKVWLIKPQADWPWLFKPVPVGPNISGEDWAEVIAADLAGLMGIPHSDAELAFRGEQRGCIVRKFMEKDWELQHGSSLLSEVVPDFDPKDPDRSGHSLENIERVLGPLAPPGGSEIPPDFSAFEIFAGYLVFDALIANQDRHSNNWGVLRPPPGSGSDRLAPSFDHGSSLGFNVRESERVTRLSDGSVSDWARRGWARQLERARGAPRVPLRELANEALARAGVAAQRHWRQRVEAVDAQAVDATVSSVPELSEATANFAIQVILANRELILDHS